MPYKVRNWEKHFENHKTRLLKTMTWIPVSTDLGSQGYAELVGGHPDGAAHFGFWIAILEMAARGTPRGHLSAGIRHHDAASMALMSRMPVTMIETALERLVSIGWLETWHIEDTSSPDQAPNPAQERQIEDDTGRYVGREGIHTGIRAVENARPVENHRDGAAASATAPAAPMKRMPRIASGPEETERLRKAAKAKLGASTERSSGEAMERDEA